MGNYMRRIAHELDGIFELLLECAKDQILETSFPFVMRICMHNECCNTCIF